MHERVKVPVSDPQAIEDALGELRRASLTEAGAGMPPARAIVVNLVGYAGGRGLANEMADWVASLAEQHPSRTIILGGEPGPGGDDLEIWVAAHCHPALVGRLVCFEEVQIMAHGPALARLPAIVLSLLLRDLPVVLWWPGDVPVGTPLFERLLANSDRLVVDSASASDPEGLLRRLVALGHAEHCLCVISDFNWDRLTPWRQLMAQFFDPPDCRPYLENIEQVRLEMVSSGQHRDYAQSELLAAWLATRLRWAPAPDLWRRTPEGDEIHLRHGRQSVRVAFAERPAVAGETAGLHGLVLTSAVAGKQAVFSIRRAPGDSQAEVTTRLPGSEVRQRVVPFPIPSPADLLSEELMRSGYDRTYADALRLAAFLTAQRMPGEMVGAGSRQ